MRARAPGTVCFLVVAVLCFGQPPPAAAQEPASLSVGQRRVINIGVVVDGDWVRNPIIETRFQTEITSLNRLDFDIRFPADKRLVGDWTVDTVGRHLDRLLADPEVDIVIALGVIASSEAVSRRDLPKPLIAPFIVNYEFQGAPFAAIDSRTLASGVPNLSYLTTPWEAGRDLEVLYDVSPFSKVAVFVDGRLLELSDVIAENIESVAAEYQVGFQIISVINEAQPALDALEPDVDAVMVNALLNMPEAEVDLLIDGINERRLPSMALFGREQVERGLLFGVAPDTNFGRVARRVAIHTQSILSGEEAGELSIRVAQPRELVLNMATARAIGFSPTWRVLTEAELINETNDTLPLLTLEEAVDQALAANLDYLASARAVAAGEQAVREAKALLLPALDSSLTALSIDPTRAAQSFGQQSQNSLAGALLLTQPIYAEAIWAGYDVQKLLQEVNVFDRETIRLDIVQAISVAYFNVLIAVTFEQIQRRNVDLSRTNLDLATAREAVGTASRSEVFRWQSEIATDRSDVIDASVQRNLVEIELNRLRNRPLEESFRTAGDIADSGFRQPVVDLIPYIDDRASFDIFRSFMVREGLRDAPELEAIDSAIEAQLRVLTNKRRNFWLPDAFFQADLSHTLVRGGAGTSAGGGAPVVFEAPDTTWSFAVNAVYPLYSGNSRYAERDRATEELELLRIQRRATAQRIEQGIRSNLHRMVGSYAQISLAEEAATAALRNLELVQSGYSQGAVNIIDLIDAQNAALTAELARATAVYVFMIDLTNVGRSISSFDFVSPRDPTARQSWLDRVEEFFRITRQREAGR